MQKYTHDYNVAVSVLYAVPDGFVVHLVHQVLKQQDIVVLVLRACLPLCPPYSPPPLLQEFFCGNGDDGRRINMWRWRRKLFPTLLLKERTPKVSHQLQEPYSPTLFSYQFLYELPDQVRERADSSRTMSCSPLRRSQKLLPRVFAELVRLPRDVHDALLPQGHLAALSDLGAGAVHVFGNLALKQKQRAK